MWANFLYGLQILELFCISGVLIGNKLWLGVFIGLGEELILLCKVIEFPKLFSCIFYFLRVRIKSLNNMMNLSIRHIILPTPLIGPLLRYIRFLGQNRISPHLQEFLFLIIDFLLLIQRQRMRIVDWMGIVKFGIFVYSGLLVVAF